LRELGGIVSASTGIKRIEHIGEKSVPGTLAALLALTSDAVLVFDGLGRVLLSNDEASSLLGLERSQLVGMDVTGLFGTLEGREVPARAAGEAPSAIEQGQPWPFPLDGSSVALSCRLPDGTGVPVEVRCDRVSGPGETFLLVAAPIDLETRQQRENDRLLRDLAQANRRLSGTLKVVLDTLDSQDVGTLISRVLEELRDTMEASGTIIYLAEKDGFRLRGFTKTLADQRVPQFMAFGESIETLATRSGHSLRLRLSSPASLELRQGKLQRREVVDEETREVHRIPAQLLPPFTSFLCVPVWFSGHVIAIIEVGWRDAHTTRREDARLLDAVAQYLSVELMAAFSTMRGERAARLDRVADELGDLLFSGNSLESPEVKKGFGHVWDVLGVSAAPLEVNSYQNLVVVTLPGPDESPMCFPFDLDEVEGPFVEDGVAVVPITVASEMGRWLASKGLYSIGALVDLGRVADARRAFLALRKAGEEPLEDVDLTFLHRISDEVRASAEGARARTQDTHISQALQSGMRNELQTVEGITARGLYSSATAAAFVGGDFYDLIRLPDRKACVILGDVSGKGVEAASVSAAVKTSLGAYAWEGLPPAHMVRSLNEFLLGFSRLETFATLFVGVIDLARGTLTYCSAGHPPAMLLRARTGELETLDVQSGVVGAFHEMAFHDGLVHVERGDLLLLYTDGVTEARSPAGAFFGEEGLREALMRENDGHVPGLLDRLLATIDSFTERTLDDDLAMVALGFDDVRSGGQKRGHEREGGDAHDGIDATAEVI
jgi:serine phosphatase RsbU (regulator of sigma subunit)/GAF domain-containing protein